MRPIRAFLVPLLAATAVTAGAATLAGASTASIWKVESTVSPGATKLTDSSLASVSASGPAGATGPSSP